MAQTLYDGLPTFGIGNGGPNRHPTLRDLAAAVGFQFAAPNDVIKFMWQVARNRDLIEDLKPERMEAVRARLTSDPEIALTCFVTGTMPRDDSTRPSDPFFRDMYRLTQGSEAVSPGVLDCDRFLRTLVQEHPDLVIRSGESTPERSRFVRRPPARGTAGPPTSRTLVGGNPSSMAFPHRLRRTTPRSWST